MTLSPANQTRLARDRRIKNSDMNIMFAGIPLACNVDIADGTVSELCAVTVGGHDIIELLAGEVRAMIESACRESLESSRIEEAIYRGEDAA